MPSWNDGEMSSDDDCQAVGMDMGLLEAPDTIVEPLFCGQLELSEPKCILHHMRPLKCVAFEGTLIGRHFYCCPVQVDGPWPPVLQRCLDKLWEMFHEENCGRVLDKEKFEKELAKLKTENDKLSMECCKLVEDVSKMFDWEDGKVDGKMNQKQMDDVAV
ncbi:hypothetical protein ZWY2020_044086 [Hordeum vulgare]|nr:hypothetical protein ZWY2020_044086 [Hordeum vulgare]